MPREVARLTSGAEDWVRVCLKAATMRSQFMTFAKIAAELDLASPKEAQRAVRQGIALTPADDVREIRRFEDQRLARIGRELLAVVLDPGPLVSQGKIMMRSEDPDVPEVPYEDQMTRVRALEALMKLSTEMRKLHGADAPKRTMAITSDMISERILELRRELGDETADQVPGLALPGAGQDGGQDQDGGPGGGPAGA